MKDSLLKKIIIYSIITIIVAIVVIYLYRVYSNMNTSNFYETSKLNNPQFFDTIDEVKNTSNSIADMIEDVNSCVVGISKLKTVGSSIFSNPNEVELGLGTGLIVSSNGYILSNFHVTGEKGSSCYVTLETGITYDATVVWADSNLDLSISKISASNLPYATLGNSSDIRAGETVYAVGNPIGFEFRQTVTSGIISAVNRTIKITENDTSSYMTDLIQTDATINPGNSGGPLLLADGSVIGINTIKISSAEGIGFAIPINIVKPIIESFAENDSFSEVYIGINAYDANVIPYLNNSSSNFNKGIYIIEITPNSPASSSDLKEGDIINSIDGIPLSTMNDLRAIIYTKLPGDSVTLNISRGKINRDVPVILKSKP